MSGRIFLESFYYLHVTLEFSKIFDHENSWILNKKFLELCVEFGILSRDRIKSGWFSILIFGEKLKLCKDPEWKPI